MRSLAAGFALYGALPLTLSMSQEQMDTAWSVPFMAWGVRITGHDTGTHVHRHAAVHPCQLKD